MNILTKGAISMRLFALAGGMAALMAVSACTTTEGTNAFSQSFVPGEDVLLETLEGIGIIEERSTKDPIQSARGPLVMPRDPNTLPPPSQSLASGLPEDSNVPEVDGTGLSRRDIDRIRVARVIDQRSGKIRDLTMEEQSKQLLSPPKRLLTRVGNRDYVCLANNGDLVSLDDPACPPAIREALLAAQ